MKLRSARCEAKCGHAVSHAWTAKIGDKEFRLDLFWSIIILARGTARDGVGLILV